MSARLCFFRRPSAGSALYYLPRAAHPCALYGPWPCPCVSTMLALADSLTADSMLFGCPLAPCKSKPRPLVPVRVPGRIVAIRVGQAIRRTVVQIAEHPGRPHAGRTVEVESRHNIEPSFSHTPAPSVWYAAHLCPAPRFSLREARASGGNASIARPSAFRRWFVQSGACGPSVPLTRPIHPAFCQNQQAAAARSSPRPRA